MFNHLNVLGSRIELWAKELPELRGFSPSDSFLIISGHRASHLLFEIFTRSVDSPSLLMGETRSIGREPSSPTGEFGRYFIYQILEPLKELKLDEMELWGMKAVLFFDACKYF